MVTVIDFKERISSDGKTFIALILQSEMEIVTTNSGSVYVAAKKCSIPSSLKSFDEAKFQLGKSLPGSIDKVQCEPYQYETGNGEAITLYHRYQYVPAAVGESHHVQDEVELLEVEEIH